MAVSLVSTGVQFPDSTIQTSAAGQPSMSANGSTIFLDSRTETWAYGSNAGTYIGSSNISTTAPTTVWQSPEVRAGMWRSPGSSQAMVVQSGAGWNGQGDYSLNWPRLQYDHYTNRYVATLYVTSGGQTSATNWYSEDGMVSWYQFQGSTNSTPGTSLRVPAFNNYTGVSVTTTSGFSDTQVRTFSAANSYSSMTSSATNTFTSPGNASSVSFIDTGTQSTSAFFFQAKNAGQSSCFIYKRLANDDGGTWGEYGLGNKNDMSRIIGMSNEIMCFSYNSGVFRSLDMGENWSNYNFGSDTQGTSAGYYWRHMAWNGSYWLGTNYSNSDRLVSKVQGSGTSWTTLTNLSTPGITGWQGVAWNPTLGFWIIVKNNVVYTNTSSNPNAGTWTLLRYLPFATDTGSPPYTPIYVKADKTYNY